MTPRPATGQTPRRTIRIPDDLWEALRQRAESLDTDVSKLVIEVVRDYLKENPR